MIEEILIQREVLNIITVEYNSYCFLEPRINSIRKNIRIKKNYVTIINSEENEELYKLDLDENESQVIYKLGNVGYSAAVQFGVSLVSKTGPADFLVINPDAELLSFPNDKFKKLPSDIMYFCTSNAQSVRTINLLTSKTSQHKPWKIFFFKKFFDGPAFFVKGYSQNRRFASGNFMYFEELYWQNYFEQSLLSDFCIKHQVGGSASNEVQREIKLSQIRGYLRFIRKKSLFLLLIGVPISALRWLIK